MSVATADAPVGSVSHKAAFDLKGLHYDYSGRSTILLVSVGADYHEGEKLGATIDLLNRSGFGRVTVAVADTLQRHNLDADPGSAYRFSRRRGDQWLARNRRLLDLLTADVDILRWDAALSDPDYPRALDRVRAAYASDAAYASAIDTTIDRFVARRGDDLPDEERVRTGCRTYLLEEVPIIQPLWAAQGYDFVVYPQQISTAMQATRDLFVESGAAWLPLRFKKRRSAR
ncbi:tRNA-dependent cyclodipeptide synthase [Gordonia sp. HY285]|uniref:Cyclodipeptide synthase n=1 Tax=Gordonia liuliyuniae TaxID=2911517 RepID=A0ABS9INQ8_9ACTN|nr:tRNA-dependent cyclodipeptide synthase [Gordonia liuliyuniae]MCF8587205.1 tRNA-dependent cyclodipeptide synthase [Gordonia liuliyuniae]MCF8608965.1 tRNA-dependent cyclodipeptide synthase [Gordonia liuliyuniae]